MPEEDEESGMEVEIFADGGSAGPGATDVTASGVQVTAGGIEVKAS